MTQTILFLPGGPTEIVVILLILVILFGPKKIPNLAKAVGESMGQFKLGKEEAEKQVEEVKEGIDEDLEDVDEMNESSDGKSGADSGGSSE
jgi:sec-independent protein translocase protein TatA